MRYEYLTVLPDSAWQCMIVLYSTWQCMTVFYNTWQFLTVPNSIWQFLTVLNSTWQCLTVLNSAWKCRTVLNSTLQCLTVPDRPWQALTVRVCLVLSDGSLPAGCREGGRRGQAGTESLSGSDWLRVTPSNGEFLTRTLGQSAPAVTAVSQMLRGILLISGLSTTALANWNEWWTYDGISGPAYWGLINPAWTMCNKVRGRH